MDLKEQQISDSSSSPSSQTKSCRDCRTTKTPLWRGGPSGPKSLCNACGIKYNKKRRALLGLKAGNKDKKKIEGLKQPQKNSSGSNGSSISSGEVGRSLKLRLVTMGGRGDMVFQQRSSSAAAVANQKQKEQQMRSKKKFGEEEQAAILLMALSCGSFY